MRYELKIVANELGEMVGAPPDSVITDTMTGITLLTMTGEPAQRDGVSQWWVPGPLAHAICDFLNGQTLAPDLESVLDQVQESNVKMARDLADTATILMAALQGNGGVTQEHMEMLSDIRGNMMRIVHEAAEHAE